MTYPTIHTSWSYKQIAIMMFEKFLLNQAIIADGWIEEGGHKYEKGNAILQYLKYLDETRNKYRGRRIQKFISNSNGVPVAHQIFKYQRVVLDGVPRWTIWRIQ